MKTINTEIQSPQPLSWEELLTLRSELNEKIEELLAHQKVLSDEFLFRLQEEKINGKVVGNYSISKATRYGFDTTLEEAKEYGATKTVVDQMALKKLLQSGVAIPGVKKTEYVMVREVVKKEKDNV